MLMPGRHYNADKYRFGFNGKEHDTEWKGSAGAIYDYGFRIYDPRVAKFLSVDPLTKEYPMLTPYQFASNTPIVAVDIDGLEGKQYREVLEKKDGTTQVKKITYELDVYLIEGTKGYEWQSNFNKYDKINIEKYLSSAFKGEFIDPKTGAKVYFKFNVKMKDFSQKVTKVKSDGTTKTKTKDMEFTDIIVVTERSKLATNVDKTQTFGFADGKTYPAFIFSQESMPNDEGGMRSIAIKIDKSKASRKSVGHEILHFMLGKYPATKHHGLKGLLGRPVTTPEMNDDILNKLREYVPRSTADDVEIKEKETTNK